MVMVEFGDGRFFVCGDFRYSKIGREEDWKKRTGDGSSDEDLDRGLPPKSPGFPLIPFPLDFPQKLNHSLTSSPSNSKQFSNQINSRMLRKLLRPDGRRRRKRKGKGKGKGKRKGKKEMDEWDAGCI